MLYYVIIINILGVLLMYADWKRASHKRLRIPALSLLGISILGGSIGILFGMYVFRHKTNNVLFMILVPAMPALQILLLVILNT